MKTDSSIPGRAPATAESRNLASPANGVISSRPQFRRFFIFTAVLLLGFALPLLHLARFALHSELYSHILLIPFITGFLLWTKRGQPVAESRSSPLLGLLSLAGGGLLLAGYWIAVRKGWAPMKENDPLALTTLAFLLFALAGSFVFLGAKYLRTIMFPVMFLLFCVPFPLAMQDGIEAFLQRDSAEVAAAMLGLSGMPVLQTGTHFQLPSFSLDVAPECSGIHSTLILVITSSLAAYLFLKKPSYRWILMLVVVPLALLRNGFRIFVIAQLCVRIGPHMIDSPIHRKGGGLFFVLSLVPLFLLLIYLSNRELRKEQAVDFSPKK